MRIGSTTSTNGTVRRQGVSRGGESGGTFAQALHGGRTSGAGTVGGLGPLTSLGALLAVQGADDLLEGRRRALRHGHDLLDSLENLRLGLLAGNLPRSVLEGLQGLVERHREHCQDQRLDRLLGEIELRAAVELAKLERRAA